MFPHVMLAEDDGRFRFGLEKLDDFVGGVPSKSLIVIGGEPGIGKTALAVALALSAAKQGALVVFFSLDASAETIASRLALQEAHMEQHVSGRDHDGECTNEESPSAEQGLCGLNIRIVDDLGISIGEIEDAVIQVQLDDDDFKQNRKRTLVVVSNLGLCDWATRREAAGNEAKASGFRDLFQQRKDRTEAQQNSAVSDALRDMAHRLDCSVVACCNIPRKVGWWADDKRPAIRDLREAGVEQAADIAIIVDRSRYQEEAQSENRPDWGKVELIVAKKLWGRTGSAWVSYDDEAKTLDSSLNDDESRDIKP